MRSCMACVCDRGPGYLDFGGTELKSIRFYRDVLNFERSNDQICAYATQNKNSVGNGRY